MIHLSIEGLILFLKLGGTLPQGGGVLIELVVASAASKTSKSLSFVGRQNE